MIIVFKEAPKGGVARLQASGFLLVGLLFFFSTRTYFFSPPSCKIINGTYTSFLEVFCSVQAVGGGARGRSKACEAICVWGGMEALVGSEREQLGFIVRNVTLQTPIFFFSYFLFISYCIY